MHRLEGVPWPKDLEYHDNQGCIDLLSKRLLLVLDECSELKNCSEASFFERAATNCARDAFFSSARRMRWRDSEGFVVRHFAGDVCYTSGLVQQLPAAEERASAEAELGVDTWLLKNKDRLLPELAAEMRTSSSPLLAALFKAPPRQPARGGRAAQGGRTVARRFGAELEGLLEDLSRTHASFIRCVKPNGVAAAGRHEARLVLSQLRCLGMTDLVRLMHSSFPTRIPYALLHGRYAAGMPPLLAELEPRAFCEAVAHICEVQPHEMCLGATRLFLKAGAFLEDLASMDIGQARPPHRPAPTTHRQPRTAHHAPPHHARPTTYRP